jgi:hypothetical protein
MKKAYLKYYSHLILTTKYDSKLPELYGLVSIFMLCFHNILNLITIVNLIVLNKSFFRDLLSNNLFNFFKDYSLWIELGIICLIVLNNIILYKQAKNLKTEYDSFQSSVIVFLYFIFTWVTWLFVVVYDKP